MQYSRLSGRLSGLRKLFLLRSRLRGELDVQALVDCGLTVGKGVYFAPWVLIDPGAAFLISIGDNTTFAPRAHVLAHDAACRHSLGYTRLAPVRIGSGVFVGADSLILPGVTIGDRAVIGAGSIVTRDVPAGAVVRGAPAEVVGTTAEITERYRERLLKSPTFPPGHYRSAAGRVEMKGLIEKAGEGFMP
ncbi:MAG TPA: acyltransferase [Acidimicrobiales bacterium]|nr:acyltransferase [Acidimicrobiales bacterium]